MDWSRLVWRILCGLTVLGGVVAFTPIFSLLPPLVQAVVVLPGLLVTLLTVVASFVPSTPSSTPSGR